MIKRTILGIFLTLGTFLNTQAQDAVGEFVLAGEDAGLIATQYLKPMFRGFGVGLNNGWYNTANVHKTGRFDLTINVNATFTPDLDKVFRADDLNTKFLAWDPKTAAQTATVFGSNTAPTASFQKIVEYNGTPYDTITLNVPKGSGYELGLVPTPMVQLGVGVIKGTEVVLRFMPTVSLGDLGSVGLFGVGVKHDVKQWIPGVKEAPFDLSVMAGYTRFNLDLGLSVPPITQSQQNTNNTDLSTQRMALGINSTTLNAIISKKLAVLTVYAGAGLMTTSTSLDILGNYVIESPKTQAEIAQTPTGPYTKETVVTDPVKTKAGSLTSPNLTAGFRLKLAVVTLGASYTLHQYNNANFNLGICVDFL